MHYYRYKLDDPESFQTEVSTALKRTADSVSTSKPRIIDKNAVLSLLLEPRSLVITSDDLYNSHLHGIDGLTEDRFESHSNARSDLQEDDANDVGEIGLTGVALETDTQVANWEMIQDEEIKRILRNGGVLNRGIRTSLTCRVVEKVRKLGGLRK